MSGLMHEAIARSCMRVKEYRGILVFVSVLPRANWEEGSYRLRTAIRIMYPGCFPTQVDLYASNRERSKSY